MNYEEALEFLFGQLPMYQNIGSKAIKKDLKNIRLLCNLINNPDQRIPSIHVAGTNGKGTVSHILAAVLQKAGYKVGLYTSPHYKDFRERIKINGKYVTEDFVSRFIDEYKDQILSFRPSFFEISLAIGLAYFDAMKVDIMVVETGLGGKLDSTNILNPLISIITRIGLDHMSMLGTYEYQIAQEKAGIMKEETPVIIGKYQNSCDLVFFERTKELKSPISFASEEWIVTKKNSKLFYSNEQTIFSFRCTSDSPFIMENIRTSLQGIQILNETSSFKVDKVSLQDGISEFEKLSNYHGRWQILQKRPLVIADSAHNVDALEKVLHELKKRSFSRLHFVLGFVREKDIDGILSLFPKEAMYYYVSPKVRRGLDSNELREKAHLIGLRGASYPSVREGLNQAIKMASDDDLVYLGGSSFVVAEVI